MTEKTQDITTTKAQEVKKTENKHDEFKMRAIRLNAIACNNFEGNQFDINQAELESQEGLKAVGATGGLQEMLVSQMLAIHQLQQISMSVINNTIHSNVNTRQYFTNTAIKLANTFVQQATLLNKLQGNGGQKIIVEHVEVHNGGQAVVGNIHGGVPHLPGVKNENNLL